MSKQISYVGDSMAFSTEGTRTSSITVDIYHWLIQQGISEIPLDQAIPTITSYLTLVNIPFKQKDIDTVMNEQLAIYKKVRVNSFTSGAIESCLAEVYERFKYPLLKEFYERWKSL